jgi:hypothetical protein
VSRYFARLRARIGLEHLDFHYLPRFMETYGQEMGYSVAQVAMRAGHDPTVAAKHYSGRVAERIVRWRRPLPPCFRRRRCKGCRAIFAVQGSVGVARKCSDRDPYALHSDELFDQTGSAHPTGLPSSPNYLRGRN